MKSIKMGRRARELAEIARTLDEKKGALPYGEFERWALKAFPKYPIQVLRYLRKAHRVFGKDLSRLLERHGQKKVFLLVGLEDPWAPLRDGIPTDGSREALPLERFSVSQLRRAIRVKIQRESQGRDGWGALGTAIERVTSLWPRVQKQPPAAAMRRDGARKQLEKFRGLLADVLGQLDLVLDGKAKRPVAPKAPVAAKPKSRRDTGFLD